MFARFLAIILLSTAIAIGGITWYAARGVERQAQGMLQQQLLEEAHLIAGALSARSRTLSGKAPEFLSSVSVAAFDPFKRLLWETSDGSSGVDANWLAVAERHLEAVGAGADGDVLIVRRIDRDGETVGYLALRRALSELPEVRKIWLAGWITGVGACVVMTCTCLAIRRRFEQRSRHLVAAVQANAVIEGLPSELAEAASALERWRDSLQRQQAAVRRTGEDLQAMLESIPDAVLAIAADHSILFVNPGVMPLFDLPTPPRVGQKLWEVVRHAAFQSAVSDVLAGSAVVVREFEILGSRRFVRFQGQRLRTGAGEGAILVLHDITERRRLEQLRQEFVANVSHELKTPLTSIKAYAETLLHGDTDRDTTAHFLARIEEQADRLHRLVVDMLLLARAESQQSTFEPAMVDVRVAVATCLANVQADAAAKELSLTEDLPEEPMFVLIHPQALNVLVGNLLDNAIKYTPARGSVVLRVCRTEQWVQIDVEDTGIGIPPDDLERIFERFYRVNKARSRDSGGTGLGLAIVKHLAHRFGGNVSVTSRVRKGSCFTVRLPAVEEPLVVAQPQRNGRMEDPQP